MPIKLGKMYTCPAHHTTIIVTKAGVSRELMCGGEILQEGRNTQIPKAEGETYVVALGKRYVWPEPPPPPKEGEEQVSHEEQVSPTEVLCITSGNCALSVDGEPMFELQPKVLPSAD